MRFGTNFISRATYDMTIANDGIVGIGTTSPGNSKLHIYADHISGHSILKIQTITAIASGGVPSLALFDADGSRNTLVYAASDGTYLANEVAKPIIFSTNGVEKMRIASDGNVGIGTSSLTAKLQIASTNNQAAIYTTGATTGFTYLQIQNSGGSNYFGMSDSNGAFWSTTPYTSYHATIGTAANIPLTFTTNNLIRMLLDNSGNLGIGTVTPATKLEVYGVVRITESASGGILQMQAGSSALDFASTFYGGTYRPFTFTNGGAERLRITSDGNVGIGTTSPGRKLDVNGDVNIGTNLVVISGIYNANYYAGNSTATYFKNSVGTDTLTILQGGNVGIGTTSPNYLTDIQSTTSPQTLNLKLNKASTTNDYAEIAFQLWSGAGSGANTFGGSGTSRPSVVLRALNENGSTAAGAFIVGTFTGGSDNSTLTEKFRITSGGNVGIGTTSPSQLLEVVGSSPIIRVLATSGNATLRLTDNGVRNWDLKVVDVNDYFEVGGTSATSLVVTGAGNVGIGTNSPAYKLEVASGTSGEQSLVNFRTADSTAANNAGVLIFATPSSTATSREAVMLLDADGANASGGDYFLIKKRGNSGTTDFEQYSNASMRFGTNFISRATYDMTIASGGNIGIGTTSPAAKLDVAGNSKLGSSISNVHQITGSLSITGSVSGINTESFHPFLLG